jgi:lipopolysaccharide assembly protein A
MLSIVKPSSHAPEHLQPKIMRLFFLLLVMLVAVIFAAQNAKPVSIDIFIWRIDASLAVVIASCFAIGVIAGVLFAVPTLYRMRSHKRRLQTQLADLGAEDLTEPETASASLTREPPHNTR